MRPRRLLVEAASGATGRSRNARLEKARRFADMNCGLFGSTHDVIAEFAWIAEIGDPPAIQVVLGHALLGESLEFIGIARGLCAEQAVAPDLLGRAAVVDFVKLVPAAELARQTVSQQLEQLDALFRLVAVRAAQILIEIRPDFRIFEIARMT